MRWPLLGCLILLGCAGGDADSPEPVDETGAETSTDATLDADASDTGDTGDGKPDADAAEVPVDAPPPLVTESLVGADVPAARVGMFYLVWHAPAVTALRTVASKGGAQLTLEDVIRGKGAYADVLTKWGVEGDAMAFYYHARPKLGFYCLYRARSGETGHVPDCLDIEKTATTHAEQLLAAGVDHVVLDATNLTGMDRAGDLLQLRPTEVLFEEWAKLRKAGKKTPQIAVWHAIPTGSTQWKGYQALYANAAYDGLVMRDKKSNKKVFFVVDPPDAGRFPDAGILGQVQSNGGKNDVIVQRMWTIGKTDPAVDRWAFMSYCQAGGKDTTSIVGAGACNQPYTAKSALGTAVAVAPSFQTSYASLPFSAAGKLSGLTFARQWETAFAVRPDYVFVSGWNEFTAQPQPNPFAGDPFAKSMGLERDSNGSNLFVDTYGMEFGRDIEPTEEYGSKYYDLTRACAKRWKGGAKDCSDAADPCCAPLSANEWAHVFVLNNAAAKDWLLTVSPTEKSALVGSGWREACGRYGTPSVSCVRADEPLSPAGPFLAWTKPGAGRKPLHRCLAGAAHFYSLDPGCEGQKTEAVLVYVADAPTGETPRRATRCYRASTGEHFVALGAGCPSGVTDEGILGYVR